jgi:hypothetical protein
MYNNDLSGGFAFLQNRTLKTPEPWHPTREYLLCGLWPHRICFICCSREIYQPPGYFPALWCWKKLGEGQLRRDDIPIQNIVLLIFSTVSSWDKGGLVQKIRPLYYVSDESNHRNCRSMFISRLFKENRLSILISYLSQFFVSIHIISALYIWHS